MAALLFALKKTISCLLLPPMVLVLLGVIGLLLLRRWPRVAHVMLWSSFTCLLLLSLPFTERVLMRGLNTPPLSAQQAQTAQAIVILGGGVNRDTPEYGDTLSGYSLERVRYGAVLARRWHLPVLVTGGSVVGGRAEADLMAGVLRDDFSVPMPWVENQALDTADNMKFSEAILQQHGVRTVILVTSDFHMQRALRECSATNLHCIAAPVTTYSRHSDSWFFELPNAGSLEKNSLALHEWLGLLAQHLH